ncbi:hypothetical protein [Oscillatoria sp. HE19RPO]|nr:hypothetical protein [Oscillatoria sp. HE19RPO]
MLYSCQRAATSSGSDRLFSHRAIAPFSPFHAIASFPTERSLFVCLY